MFILGVFILGVVILGMVVVGVIIGMIVSVVVVAHRHRGGCADAGQHDECKDQADQWSPPLCWRNVDRRFRGSHHDRLPVGTRVVTVRDVDALPEPNDRRLAVRITKDALRHVRSGHPWIFSDSIVSVGLGAARHPAAAGDLAVVFDDDRQFAAIGLFDPSSPIRVRVLHQGKPTTIDQDFWDRAVATAHRRRESLLADGGHTGYRWVNGENDGLGGLIVDRYADVTVIKLYSRAWFPRLRAIVDALQTAKAATAIVLRLARNVARSAPPGLSDGSVLLGSIDGDVVFQENGLRLAADVVSGQKTGTFLDQRHNRAKVGSISEGRSVLDVFSCTGGFTVAAAAGGARSVHSVDQSPQAIQAVGSNLARNGLSAVTATTATADAFDEMGRLVREGARFDVAVVDPPSFAPRQRDVDAALSAYRRLTRLGAELVEPGGCLVQASCTARVARDLFVEQFEDQIERSGRSIRRLEITGHDVDHPVSFPEGAYLKAVFAELD